MGNTINRLNAGWIRKLRHLSTQRPSLTKDAFLEEMIRRGHAQYASTLVYEEFMAYLPSTDGFSLHPEDDAIVDYDIWEDDIGDIMVAIFKKLNSKIPSQNKQIAFFEQKHGQVTLENLVEFIEMHL